MERVARNGRRRQAVAQERRQTRAAAVRARTARLEDDFTLHAAPLPHRSRLLLLPIPLAVETGPLLFVSLLEFCTKLSEATSEKAETLAAV